jgi:chromosome segregation ATPase
MNNVYERETTRQIANATIAHMELLKQALDAADFQQSQAETFKQMAQEAGEELVHAKDRHVQDEATIQIKDSEIAQLHEVQKQNEAIIAELKEKLEEAESQLESASKKKDPAIKAVK